MMLVIGELPGHHHYPIRQSDFDLASADTMASTFGKHEVEKAAANIIRFCQRRGGWYPFTVEELIAFYKEVGENPRFIFFGLLGAWEDDGMLAQLSESRWRQPRGQYIAIGCDGMYRVTESFIKRCKREKPVSV